MAELKAGDYVYALTLGPCDKKSRLRKTKINWIDYNSNTVEVTIVTGIYKGWLSQHRIDRCYKTKEEYKQAIDAWNEENK